MISKIKEPALCIKEESTSLSDDLDNPDKTDRPMCPVTTVDTMHGRSLLMSKAFTPQAMFKAFHDLKKPIRFKESVQKYELNAFRNIAEFITDYQNGDYHLHRGAEFNLSERGKIRHICATPIYDRVPVRSFCDNVLIPALRPYLIYDNCASLKGRGIDMQRNRMKVHLQKYFREQHANNGYILQGDFSKFFDNLDHAKIIKAIGDKLHDTDSLLFLKMVLKSFCLDFSNCSDSELEDYKNSTKIINSLNFRKAISNTAKTIAKGVEIGSEVSQIIGVFYPYRLDNYIKIVKGCKFYGRYMDDFYLIHHDKQYLRWCLECIAEMARSLGLELNGKTQLIPFRKGIRFLGFHHYITADGKYIRKLTSENKRRMRKHLTGWARAVKSGKMSEEKFREKYAAWKNHALHGNCVKLCHSMDLFVEELMEGE